MKKAICFLLAAALLIPGVCNIRPATVSASENGSEELKLQDSHTYRQYLLDTADKSFSGPELVVKADAYTWASEDAGVQRHEEYQGKNGILLWNGLGGFVEWKVTVPVDSLYCMELTYMALNSEARSVEFGLTIDGEEPFSTAANIELPRVFRSKGKIETDVRGNDVRPDQTAYDIWMTESLRDNSGVYNDPYRFFLTAGTQTLRLEGVRATVALEQWRLYQPEKLPSYASYAAGAVLAGEMETEFIEGETPFYQSDSILYPIYDRSSADTSPSDPVKLKMNTIGRDNWASHGQSITWRITVEEAGYYKIGVRFKQSLQRDMTSYRRLYINGKVPFEEANALAFPFSGKWQTAELGDGWLIYLNAGENELKLEAVPGPISDVLAELENTVFMMNTLYRKIIMITSVNPDPNRDYMLEKEIPDLTAGFQEIRASCEKAVEQLNQLSGKNTGATTSALQATIVQMDSFLEKPETVASRITLLRDNISGLSDMVNQLKSQPLEIDYISLGTTAPLFHPKKSLWESFRFSLNKFMGSFFEDYDSIGAVSNEKPVEVWINIGRDQAQVIKDMADSMFTPKTGIPVNVSLVKQSLIQATLSNNGPDVVVFVAANDPVNLAARGAVVDLKQFDTFENTLNRFQPNAALPYEFNGGCYALPLTEDFPVMYYRTDIFEELGLTPPKTWEEFYEVVSVLQHNNMTAGVPNMQEDDTTGMSVYTAMYAILLSQMGGSYMKDDLTATYFDSPEGVEAFKMWTGFYSMYGLPYQFDFFNRFRTGEMPLGFAAYTIYNKLAMSAPEIKGMWEMLPIPGLENSDGSIRNQTVSGGMAMLMLKNTENPEQAWDFMDWFSGDEAQVSYGLAIESLLGAAGRYNPANRNAFLRLPWSVKQQQNLLEQWDKCVYLPQVPGGYFIDRNLTNAFRQVVIMNKNPRETLLDYNKEINQEISRKRKEFHLD